jgi:hypothetical protein
VYVIACIKAHLLNLVYLSYDVGKENFQKGVAFLMCGWLMSEWLMGGWLVSGPEMRMSKDAHPVNDPASDTQPTKAAFPDFEIKRMKVAAEISAP